MPAPDTVHIKTPLAGPTKYLASLAVLFFTAATIAAYRYPGLLSAQLVLLHGREWERDVFELKQQWNAKWKRARKLLQHSPGPVFRSGSGALSGADRCTDPTYNCDYFDYGVNIEGTGSLGILQNVLLNQINGLASQTPRLAARAKSDTAVIGTSSATRRNTTIAIQNKPSRDAGLYSAGTVGIDPNLTVALSAGTASAVAKNIVAVGFPVNNYGSSGETFAIVNATDSLPGRDSSARALSGGLATAGANAVATTTGTYQVGPVIGIFNAGNRPGAASQNAVFSQTIGTQSSTYLQTSSLGAVSPGNKKFQQSQQPGSLTLPNAWQGTERQQPDSQLNDMPDPNPVQTDGIPFEDYYYGDYEEDKRSRQTNAAGGVSKGWMVHQDLLTQPSTRSSNTRASLSSFGAANGYGWTRGVTESNMIAYGTLNAGARLRTGAFGTGASALSAVVASVTDLQAVKCKKTQGENKGGDMGGVDNNETCQPDPQAQHPINPRATDNAAQQPDGSLKKATFGVVLRSNVNAAWPTSTKVQDATEDDLMTPELKRLLDPLGLTR